MIVGNFAALMQGDLKRMLAYSSIAHAGYVMVAIAAHNEVGTSRDVLHGLLRADERRCLCRYRACRPAGKKS